MGSKLHSLSLHGINTMVKKNNMNIKSLIEASEMSQTKFAQYLGIPLRTVQNWATEKNACPEWTKNLIEFRLKAEGVINMMYIIRDREAGNEIARFNSLAEAEQELRAYEEADKNEGTFTEDFYEIVTE